jgi:dipeptidase E
VRLYLSSFRIGNHPDRLLDLAGSGRRVALICNALDDRPDDIRQAGVDREVADLNRFGFAVTEVDLRAGRDAKRQLATADVLWVRGGNAFVLRQAMADSGADAAIVELIETDAAVYAGYSAGACVLAPDLHGFELVDEVPAMTDPVYSGLGILDRPFVPHVDSPGHPETDACDRVSAKLTAAGQPHWALSDGEVLLARNSSVELLSRHDGTGLLPA